MLAVILYTARVESPVIGHKVEYAHSAVFKSTNLVGQGVEEVKRAVLLDSQLASGLVNISRQIGHGWKFLSLVVFRGLPGRTPAIP